MFQYIQDYDELFPSRYQPNNIGPGRPGAAFVNLFDVPTKTSLMSPYLKNTDVFKCPSNKADPVKQSANYNYSYGYNQYLIATGYLSFSDCTPVTTPQNVPVSQVVSPASMILFGDDTWDGKNDLCALQQQSDRHQPIHLGAELQQSYSRNRQCGRGY